MTNQEQVQELGKQIDEITSLLEDRAIQLAGTTRYKGKSYTLKQLIALRTEKQEKRKSFAVKAAEDQKAKEEEIVSRSYKLPVLEKNYKNAVGMLDAAVKQNGNIEKAQNDVVAADAALREYDPQNKLLPQAVTPVKPTPSTSTTPTAPATGVMATAPNETVARSMAKDKATPKPTSVETKRVNGEVVRVETYADGTVKTSKDLSIPASTPTPTATSGVSTGGGTGGGAKGRGKAGVEKAIVKPVSTTWEPKFREMFPAKAWLLDLDRAKYPKLFTLIQKAMDEKYYESAEGKARFEEELKGTDFYQELAVSGKARVVKSLVGDLGFDSTDFSKFLSDAINYGWDNDVLKQKTYEEVFRRNPDGTLANPTALARARKSNDFLNVQLIATKYFNKASDSTIESVLTGRITTEDFQRQQREIAKAKYGHLAPLIDQGVTLDDLATNFKTSAARLLEVDPETIDMGSADYEIALNYGEEGKKRVMTTGEWERMLRTDSRYGWEKTENAKAEARSLASNIAQAFGRII